MKLDSNAIPIAIHGSDIKEHENRRADTSMVLSISHKIDVRSNPHPLPWILMYNQNAEKAAVNPDPDDTPLS